MYIELHTASAFSFLEGASLPEALVDQAARYGYSALALLDRDGVYGAPRFHRAAIAAGIRPIIGAELSLSMDRTSHLPHPSHLSHPIRLPVLIESQEGYQNLCRLVTRMKMRAPKGEGALSLADLDGATRGLVALAGRELLGAERYGVGGLIDPLVGLQAYGVLPFPMNQDDEDRMHGNDERIPLASLDFGTRLMFGAVHRVAR